MSNRYSTLNQAKIEFSYSVLFKRFIIWNKKIHFLQYISLFSWIILFHLKIHFVHSFCFCFCFLFFLKKLFCFLFLVLFLLKTSSKVLWPQAHTWTPPTQICSVFKTSTCPKPILKPCTAPHPPCTSCPTRSRAYTVP